jgi:hypothetical protein
MATITQKLCAVLACASGIAVAQRAQADTPPPPDDTSPVIKNDGPITPPPAPTVPASGQPQSADPNVPANDPSVPPPSYAPAPAPIHTTTTTTTTEPIEYSAAEEGTHVSEFGYAWREPHLMSGIGVGFNLGGGLTGFTDHAMHNTVTSTVGGLWDARMTVGTHVPIGLDVSYVGTAANINTFEGASNGTLIGSTVEGALRWNILPHYTVNPYIFAGVGWQRYDIHNMKFATSDTGLASTDSMAEFPMGTGMSVRDISGFTFDLRGTFRATQDSTLVLDQSTANFAKLHSWEASGSLGYEF